MSWTTADIPDLTGRTAVVTGGNGGLGLVSVRELAAAGAHVVMAARNGEKAAAARDAILREHPESSVEVVRLDLGSLDSVRAAAAAIAARHQHVDILLNNAGLMAMPERRTADGYEEQLGVNHLGHWVLTDGLLAPLVAADAARVVTVTSTAHHLGRVVDPDDVNLEHGYDPWRAYGRAKLANLHFALGLQRDFERHRTRAASLAAHPGLSHTNLQVHTVAEGGGGRSAPFWAWLAEHTGMSAEDGALSQLRAATDPRARGGELYGPRWVNNGAPVRKPVLRRDLDRGIANLWLVSKRETGAALDVGAHGNPA
jgi:NAD(P)-dependent dehydrogenase (short-subunit alcohol dehydrogenase family)